MYNVLACSLPNGCLKAAPFLRHWPGIRGGTIAAEVLDSSDSLREICAKCGRNLTCGGLPLITCTGICQPRRTLMDVKILSTDCA